MANATAASGARMTSSISRRNSAVTHSSASRASTQSPLAASMARFLCGPGPGQSAVT